MVQSERCRVVHAAQNAEWNLMYRWLPKYAVCFIATISHKLFSKDHRINICSQEWGFVFLILLWKKTKGLHLMLLVTSSSAKYPPPPPQIELNYQVPDSAVNSVWVFCRHFLQYINLLKKNAMVLIQIASLLVISERIVLRKIWEVHLVVQWSILPTHKTEVSLLGARDPVSLNLTWTLRETGILELKLDQFESDLYFNLKQR